MQLQGLIAFEKNKAVGGSLGWVQSVAITVDKVNKTEQGIFKLKLTSTTSM